MIPGSDRKTDSEYIRNGTVSIFAFVESLGGTHHISVREYRTAIDWAGEIRYLADTMYPDAEKIILVMDNLNTHKPTSLYKRYPHFLHSLISCFPFYLFFSYFFLLELNTYIYF